jgi:hypothetical protein
MSTVKDLVTWETALAAGRVVTVASLAQMWTPVRLNDGSSFPYGFGWSVDERRGHRWIAHTGITGTEFSRFPDDKLTAIVLTNLGARIGARELVNPWGLTLGVAGRYIPGMLVSTQKAEPDPDPAATERLRDILGRLARGENVPTVNPRLPGYVGKDTLTERLRTLQSFTFVTCDDVRGRNMEMLGERVSRICHYRLVNAEGARYYSFFLTGDGRVATFWSTTE